MALSACKSAPPSAQMAIYLVSLEADQIWNGRRYRAVFAADHPECIESTVESDGAGGSCITTRGCRKEIFCFLDCDEELSCP